jgi:hypothetical protein
MRRVLDGIVWKMINIKEENKSIKISQSLALDCHATVMHTAVATYTKRNNYPNILFRVRLTVKKRKEEKHIVRGKVLIIFLQGFYI